VVADPITVRERDRNEMQGVGGVNSTNESGDSTTPDKGRNPALCMPIYRGGVFYSLERGYED